MPVAAPEPNDPFDSSALRRAIEQMTELQLGPARQAAERAAGMQLDSVRRTVEMIAGTQLMSTRRAVEQMAGIQLISTRRAVEQMAGMQLMSTRQAVEQMAGMQLYSVRQAAERAAALQMGPLREMADRLAALQTQPMLDALRTQSARIDRVLSATFQAAGSTSLAEVWSEHETGLRLEAGEATDRVADQLQARLPQLSRETVRWLVIAWATAMVFASTLYLSMEHPKGFDEVWTRVGPPLIIASLANSIFVSNYKRPRDKE